MSILLHDIACATACVVATHHLNNDKADLLARAQAGQQVANAEDDRRRQLLVEGRRQLGVLVDGLHQVRRAAREHHLRDVDSPCRGRCL